MASGRLALSKRRLALIAMGVAGAASLGLALGRPAAHLPSALTHQRRGLDPSTLEEGDIVFRSGTDAFASLVRAQSESAIYSHVGMLVHLDAGWRVVHAMPEEPGSSGGVLMQELDGFTAPDLASAVGHFRVDRLSATDRNTVRHYLLSQIGKPFDYRFRTSDDSAHYCTELVIKALREAGIDLEPSLKPIRVLAMAESAIAPDSLMRCGLLRAISAQQLSAHQPAFRGSMGVRKDTGLRVPA